VWPRQQPQSLTVVQEVHHQPPQAYRHRLEQEPYNALSHTTTTPALELQPIYFVDSSRRQSGIRAVDMLNGAFQNLERADEMLPIPEDVRQKITIRIQVGSMFFHRQHSSER
jgi:hypothetical protein